MAPKPGPRQRVSYSTTIAVLCHFFFVGTAFFIPDTCAIREPTLPDQSSSSLFASQPENVEQNSLFIGGLMENLSGLCDKYIMNGSPKTREKVSNVFDQISATALDKDLVKQSMRMIKRAGVPMEKTLVEKYEKELGRNDATKRRIEAQERKKWDEHRTSEVGLNVAKNVARSALSRRSTSTEKPDLFMPSVLNPDSIAKIDKDKTDLQREMNDAGNENNNRENVKTNNEIDIAAASRVSELIAKAGAGASFEGETLEIGGLDDVLAQVKRRVWTPLAAPPQLLKELGIHPVRGLLLYGKPGCGKTLLARTLGKILSPMRPITVVSGPEIMDKFVGSSEKNLREIFDNPPDIYDTFRLGEADGGDTVAAAALHVVVMDEFDAVARTRGGRGGKGDQGDAGVARDSVVNQLLAKMDGVDPLPVPTLVIGLTNKRSLIEPALLRPGRFEVQVEVPPPRSMGQRVSILKVHTRNMNEAGRLLVSDPPAGTAADKFLKKMQPSGLLSYASLLEEIARNCEGFSGAALAGVARAAASHALERAVNEFSRFQEVNGSETAGEGSAAPSIMDCIVTFDDFDEAVADVSASMGNSDYADESDADEEKADGSTGDDSEEPVSPE